MFLKPKFKARFSEAGKPSCLGFFFFLVILTTFYAKSLNWELENLILHLPYRISCVFLFLFRDDGV